MTIEPSVENRLAVHRALADETRLAIVDALVLSDRTPSELRRLMDAPSNLLAFHLETLEKAGLVSRHPSQGDARRRYVRLEPAALPFVQSALSGPSGVVLFICTHNAARSQIAEALWRARTGGAARSAGSQPAESVDPTAVEVAAAHGLDLSEARPRGYDAVDVSPDLVVSVCDRAAEAGQPFTAPRLHWSVADPLGRDRDAFKVAFADIASRIGRLAEAFAA
jgi:ArsR family transcriptional regulator, arsenate/arsenite/antimonite-responsive transcriptional repressor / arsenate reductase (thioredoxin)